MIPPEIDDVLDAWRLPRPRTVTPAKDRYQNTTLFVRCAAGEYVLKIYSNTRDRAHRRFEHELLGRLKLAELPFAVPRPVPGARTAPSVNTSVSKLFAKSPASRSCG